MLELGDSIPSKIDAGLEQSRVLVLCLSAQAFGSDWAQLEACTFRFRDPLNQERRFIPLRLDFVKSEIVDDRVFQRHFRCLKIVRQWSF